MNRPLVATVLAAACVVLTLGLATFSAALLGAAPVDFNAWLIAFVAVAGLAAHLAVPGPKRPESVWRCYRCGRSFVYARFLTAHLIEIHNEQPALSALAPDRPARPTWVGSGSRVSHSGWLRLGRALAGSPSGLAPRT